MKKFEKIKSRSKNYINNSNILVSYNNIIENDLKKIRFYYFDILRIVSSFSVVLIHTSAKHNKLNINSNNWKIAFYYNGISRFGVPVFFMMSGALFLNKDISFRQICNNYIRRLLTKLIIWSFIYSIYRINLSKKNLPKITLAFFSGNYHLWLGIGFLDVIIELYLVTPFLREIIKKDLLKAFIKLSFIFTFIIPNIYEFISYFPQILSRIMAIVKKN